MTKGILKICFVTINVISSGVELTKDLRITSRWGTIRLCPEMLFGKHMQEREQ
jgi:hypothetical protein